MPAEVLASLAATGVCVLFLTGGGLAAAGAAQRLLPGEHLAGRLAASVVLWHLLLVVLALPLLGIGLFSFHIAASIFVGTVAVILAVSWKAALELFRDTARAWASLDTADLAPWQRGVVWLAAGTLLCALFRAFILPPVSWDGLIYHLWLPAEWVRTYGLFQFRAPENWDACQFFPMNWEIIAAWIFRFSGDDRFINLVNYPFLFQMFCATVALCRLFGTTPSRALLGGATLCLNAAAFTYVNSAYVENAMTAHLLTAYYCLFRALSERSRAMAGISAAAFGLAIGTKLVALPHLAVASLPFIYLLISKRHRLERPLLTGILLFAVLAGTSSFWYIRAWAHTGTPLYPYGISVAGTTLFPGSEKHGKYLEYLQEKAVEVSRQVKDSSMTKFLILLPMATTCGPLVLFLLPLLPGGIRKMAAYGGWTKTALLLAGSLFTLTGYFSDRMFPIRFFWAESSSRFLLFPVTLMIIAAMVHLSTMKRATMAENAIWGCLALSLMMQIPQSWDTGRKELNLILYIFMCVCFLCGILAKSGWFLPDGGRLRIRAVVAFLVLWVWTAPFIHASMRSHSFRNAYELFYFSRDQAPAWEFCDHPERPLRISVSTGFDGRGGNNWFMYPLLGRKLQNTVYYSPTTKSGKIIDSFIHPPETVLRQGDRDAWLARLRNSSTDYLVLLHPFPPEAYWAEKSSDILAPVVAGEKVRIYKVMPSS